MISSGIKMGTIRFSENQFVEQPKTSNFPSLQKAAFFLAIIVLILTLFGLAMLYSTSSGVEGAKLFVKQMVWSLLGIFGVLLINQLGYKKLLHFSLYFIIICWVLLMLARLNRPINGSHRWIRVGSFSIQPSEFAKLAIIMFLAHFCATKQRFLNDFKKGLIPIGAVCGITAGLIFLGKDLGTTILVVLTCGAMLFVAGIKIRSLILPIIVITPMLIFYLKGFDPERWSRIVSFIDPEAQAQGSGYQLWNSLLALGSGSWTGLGFTKSRMKAFYLPEAHTDFILAITGEELGYIFILFIIFCYFSFMCLSIYISINSPDRQGMFLGFGIAIMIAIQSIINLGVISGGLPTKGIPAPFISYGGSNLLVNLCCAGLIISIATKMSTEPHDESDFFSPTHRE